MNAHHNDCNDQLYKLTYNYQKPKKTYLFLRNIAHNMNDYYNFQKMKLSLLLNSSSNYI